MYENLLLLYRVYGGFSSLLRSAYFWTAFALTVISSILLDIDGWESIALGALPSLTGFTIASFALIFSALSGEQIELLLKKKGDEHPPLLRVAAAICHAVFVQLVTIILGALKAMSVPTENVQQLCAISDSQTHCMDFVQLTSNGLEAVSEFLLIYSFLLVLAAVLSLLRMLASIAGAA